MLRLRIRAGFLDRERTCRLGGDAEQVPGSVRTLRKIACWYRAAAILLLNTLLMFAALNLVLWAAIDVRRAILKRVSPVSGKYPVEALRKAYAPASDDQWKQLLDETWHRPLGFEEFVQVRESAHQGRYVNVSEHGFRLVPNQGPWPIDRNNYNVFMIGGSTTFGFGVADDQTVPAWLQKVMPRRDGRRVCVYNFGRSYYYSTPERILFEQLLLKGARPDLAIFMDGLNDFYTADDPFANTVELTREAEAASGKSSWSHALAALRPLPALRVGEFLSQRLRPASAQSPVGEDALARVIRRYVWNKRAIELIGSENGVETFFVFQPAPTYHYDLNYQPFKGDELLKHRSIAGYPLMARYVNQHPMGSDFLWLADMQEGVQKSLYCDQIHYTGDFSKQIAEEIARFVESSGNLPRRASSTTNPGRIP
jgi:hypothetical protein